MSSLFWIIPLFTGVAGFSSDTFTLNRRIPQYVQANLTFARTKQYFQDNLPYGNYSYITNENREFAVLCGLTAKLVQTSIFNGDYSISPAQIQEYAQYAKQNYDEIAKATHELFLEATRKISPVLNLINSVCSPGFFPDCNERVDARILGDLFTYNMPAKLQIHLGKISRNIMRNQFLIENLTRNSEVVQYFTLHARDSSIGKIMKKLARSYTILKMMGTVYA